MDRIYFDHAATTPMHPKVIERMTQEMQSHFGNPSSVHAYGREARQRVDKAREILAASIGADESEIIFTSGGTEGDNLALFGIVDAYKKAGKHIITSEIEHHAVLHSCAQLEQQGYEVTYLPVDETGVVSVDAIKNALREDTILVSIMAANNEVGTLQPIGEIGDLLKSHQALFHTDAVQAYGVEKINVKEMGIDLLSVTAHKINGPKGIGFLYVGKEVKITSQVFGGEQERKRRAGTENVPAIAGFSEAVHLAHVHLQEKRKELVALKTCFLQALQEHGVDFSLNGDQEHALPHVVNLSFPGTNVEAMLVNLDLAGIAASSGSACTAGTVKPSHVLVSMFGEESPRLKNSLRFSFGLYNTEAEILHAVEKIAAITKRFQENNQE